jgi:hypothetical protein
MPITRFMTAALSVFSAFACMYAPADLGSSKSSGSRGPAPSLASELRVAVDTHKQVLVITNWDADCGVSAAPHVAVTQQPVKGFVSFVPVPEAAPDTRGARHCPSWRASGIGVVYNAGNGKAGSDVFTISALHADGGMATHAVHIVIGD